MSRVSSERGSVSGGTRTTWAPTGAERTAIHGESLITANSMQPSCLLLWMPRISLDRFLSCAAVRHPSVTPCDVFMLGRIPPLLSGQAPWKTSREGRARVDGFDDQAEERGELMMAR